MTHLVLEIHFTGQLWQDAVQIIHTAYQAVQIISHKACSSLICPFASATTNKGAAVPEVGQTC